MKVLTVFGTRPEAIKLAPVVRALRRKSADGSLESVVCVTGQHRQMLDQVLELFDIVPDTDLDLMRSGQSPTQVAARVLAALEPVLRDQRPDWMLVQGDTTTVMAAAIAAHYGRVRVGHVEAGLRTGDRMNPFPEEMNRIIADHISDMHFAPTEGGRHNLRREGVADASIHVTGNTSVDALLWASAQPPNPETRSLFAQMDIGNSTDDGSRRMLLVTAHRRENFGSPLRQICRALAELVHRHEDLRVVYPVHLNPNVWKPVHELLEGVPRVTLLPPLDYLTLVHLMKRSYLVLTDSGGIQEEAPTLGVPMLILRETTERPEAVLAGAGMLVGTDPERIRCEAERLLEDTAAYEAMASAENPYGDGHAAERIVTALAEADS